jgi:hypothetical protein
VRLSAIAVCAAVAGALLSGCGDSTTFTQRTDDTCAHAITTIAALDAPTDPGAGLRYALDRFGAIDLAVSTVTDSTLPSGAEGDQLRQRWLQPARASLARARPALAQLQTDVQHGDRAQAAAAFATAAGAGTGSVDPAVLTGHGLLRCAALFSAGAAAAGW